MNIFEGYVGIRLWDGQLVDDVIFSAVIPVYCLFLCVPDEFPTVCEDAERCFSREGKAESI